MSVSENVQTFMKKSEEDLGEIATPDNLISWQGVLEKCTFKSEKLVLLWLDLSHTQTIRAPQRKYINFINSSTNMCAVNAVRCGDL